MTAVSGTSHHPIPRQPGSSENVGPFVDVVTWILLITSALAVLTRLITKRALSRRIDVDDAFVIAALVSLVVHLVQSFFLFADDSVQRLRALALAYPSASRQPTGWGATSRHWRITRSWRTKRYIHRLLSSMLSFGIHADCLLRRVNMQTNCSTLQRWLLRSYPSSRCS